MAFVWKKHIFCDTVLSMGLRSASGICQRATNAISFMMFQIGINILNYLDDLAGAETEEKAAFAYKCLEAVLQKYVIEESPEKAVYPTQIMVFLGVLFNTVTMTLEVTPERLAELRAQICQWIGMSSASLKQIQSLLGKLNFIASCVRPSRLFMFRMFNWLRGIYSSSASTSYLIPEEVRKDLLWWHRFLPVYNGISMMQTEKFSEPDSVFASDSSLSACGGFWHGTYFHAKGRVAAT